MSFLNLFHVCLLIKLLWKSIHCSQVMLQPCKNLKTRYGRIRLKPQRNIQANIQYSDLFQLLILCLFWRHQRMCRCYLKDRFLKSQLRNIFLKKWLNKWKANHRQLLWNVTLRHQYMPFIFWCVKSKGQLVSWCRLLFQTTKTATGKAMFRINQVIFFAYTDLKAHCQSLVII